MLAPALHKVIKGENLRHVGFEIADSVMKNPNCLFVGYVVFMEKQTVTRKRVADHGEVFTSKREVNAMLDLVKQETERIDSRFLEPACGIGNFLVEILERKLSMVEARYRKSRLGLVKQ